MGCWHWSHMLWLRIRLMSLNGADPSGQAGGGPWDSIRHRRMMKDVLALQNGISYIYISYLQILYFYIIIIISLLDLILRHWGWWITVFPRSSTILLRCAFAGKASMVIFDPLLCIIWDVGVSNVIQLVTFWWLDDFIPSSQLENMKCTWLKFLGSWVRIPEICLLNFASDTGVVHICEFYQKPLREVDYRFAKKSRSEVVHMRHVYNGH